MTDLPKSWGKTAVMVVVDLLTKMCHFIACSHAVTAEETARLFVEHIFRLHGAPSRVISDRRKQFTSRFWRKLMSLLQVEVGFSTARHPETNGQAERVNSILQQYPRCYVSERQNDWVEKLALAEFAYNNAEHVSTGMSPFMDNYGCHPRAFPGSGEESWSVPAAEQFVEEMEALHQQLKMNLEQAKEIYKRQVDKRRREGETIRVGDRVWLSTQGLPFKGGCKKLQPRRLGPFEVTQQVNPVAFKLKLPDSMKIHPVFHRSLLSPHREGRGFPGREGEVTTHPQVEEREHHHLATEIVDSRWRGRQVEYLVAWEGEPGSENTWVPTEAIDDRYLVEEFHRLFPDKPKPLARFWEEQFGTTDDEEDFEEFSASEGEGGEVSEEEESDWEAHPAGRNQSGWEAGFESSEDGDSSFRGFPASSDEERDEVGSTG
uniref:Integrase catalytic domain-containing protein n=1 Tax=Podarcis muralis TaxID=64176 RepID=A0A670KDM5_PODMU